MLERVGGSLAIRIARAAACGPTRRFDEAELVYREDLARLPGNDWSLYGLARSLRLQGRTADADAVDAQFAAAWANADVPLRSSCFCQPGV